jgi:hypothetical protein
MIINVSYSTGLTFTYIYNMMLKHNEHMTENILISGKMARMQRFGLRICQQHLNVLCTRARTHTHTQTHNKYPHHKATHFTKLAKIKSVKCLMYLELR